MRYLLALPVLVLAGCAGHLASPPAPTPPAPLELDVSDIRPLHVDVNGDGVSDLIVRTRGRDTYLALDGRIGARLWETARSSESLGSSFAFVAEGRLVSVSRYVATLYDATTGVLLRSIDLEDASTLPCQAPPGRLRLANRDGTVTSIEIATGKLEKEPVTAECVELTSSGPSDRDIVARRYRPVPFLPADMHAIECGQWHVRELRADGQDTSFSEPDACLEALGAKSYEDLLPGIEPTAIVETKDGWLVLGQKRRGHPLPVLALASAGALSWSTALPTQRDGSPRDIAIDGGRVAVLYDDQLTTLDLESGAIVSQEPIPSGTRWLHASGGRWIALNDRAVIAFDASKGAPTVVAGDAAAALPAWQPGAPVPPGYRVERTERREWAYVGLGAAGMVALTAINCGVAYALEDDGGWPLYIPTVGPFVAMGTVELDQFVVGVLLGDFFLQGLATTAFTLGLAITEETQTLVPVRTSFGPGSFRVDVAF